MGPAGLPSNVVDTLNAAVAKAALNDTFKQHWYEAGLTLKGSTPEWLRDYVIKQKAVWAKVVEDAGIKKR